MGDPSKVVATGDFEEDLETDASTDDASALSSFEELVNTTVESMTQDSDGKWQVPDKTPPEIAYAAKLERRRRNTQSALNKTQQELLATKAKESTFRKKLEDNIHLNLTDEQIVELEELKENNPEAWRAKINEFEGQAKTKLNEELEAAGYDAEAIAEVERRANVLEDFIKANPGLVLNDDVFENDLPPRITGKLNKGEVSFEEFLEECKTFLTANKKVKTDQEEDEPDLGKTGGGSDVSKVAQEMDIEKSYKETIF